MPRARGWVWEHYGTKLDIRGRRYTSCNYCDNSLAGRGNPMRMTRHLALYCLAVPPAVKTRASQAIRSMSTSLTPLEGNSEHDSQDHPRHADVDDVKKPRTLSPIQQSEPATHEHTMNQDDSVLLSHYMAPTAHELLARAISASPSITYEDLATPEWYDFFQALGYALPSKATLAQPVALRDSSGQPPSH
ncbi:unnamed protein product [Aphanomyces euteiches]|uniref:Uncharacterized protein n=1 Tax=Aphanomyces euteiches TaxID=100861 RepID=A0A6G0XHH8_9STRA|nr:hypothetical protein Ae201684_004885 [Aphanomyces euteiches]